MTRLNSGSWSLRGDASAHAGTRPIQGRRNRPPPGPGVVKKRRNCAELNPSGSLEWKRGGLPIAGPLVSGEPAPLAPRARASRGLESDARPDDEVVGTPRDPASDGAHRNARHEDEVRPFHGITQEIENCS